MQQKRSNVLVRIERSYNKRTHVKPVIVVAHGFIVFTVCSGNAPVDRRRAGSNKASHTVQRALILIESATIRGAAKSVLTFLAGLRASGDCEHPQSTYSVATFHRRSSPDPREPELATAARDLGFDVHVIQERRRWDPAALRQLANIADERNPDLIHSNNVKSHAMIKALGLQRRCAWIASHHGYTHTDFKMRCYNQLDRWSLRSARRVIVPCHAFKDQLSRCGIPTACLAVVPNSGVVIPRPAEREISATRARLKVQNGERVILCIGRLSAEKGHIDLIRSLQLLSKSMPRVPCRLLLVGAGPELKNLQTAAVRLGVDAQISFLQDEPDITPLLHVADAFALPSHSDGSPHVIFEAIGAGLPIVSTAVGGLPEMLTDEHTGVLVDARRPESLAAGLMRVLLNPGWAEMLAHNALGLLNSRYAPDAYVSRLLRVYSEAISSTSNKAV